MTVTVAPQSTASRASDSLPVLARDRSSRSSMICACDSTVFLITSAARATDGSAFASGSRASSSALRWIRLSGFFSSCDMTARNSSFSTLAASASARPAVSLRSSASRSRSVRRLPVRSRAILA